AQPRCDCGWRRSQRPAFMWHSSAVSRRRDRRRCNSIIWRSCAGSRSCATASSGAAVQAPAAGLTGAAVQAPATTNGVGPAGATAVEVVCVPP
ncbi:unnamed protein product, partial [Pylaiella littoralis]